MIRCLKIIVSKCPVLGEGVGMIFISVFIYTAARLPVDEPALISFVTHDHYRSFWLIDSIRVIWNLKGYYVLLY